MGSEIQVFGKGDVTIQFSTKSSRFSCGNCFSLMLILYKKIYTHALWCGNSHPRPMVWESTPTPFGVGINTHTLWCGNPHLHPMVWEFTQTSDGVGIHTHTRWCGNPHKLPMVWESTPKPDGVGIHTHTLNPFPHHKSTPTP
ncbi:unnamed protein product [Orchesella dallaii]|uniref:Uncharacterized protein n=1 Tax=Orchesella dallaii TaxID=48710 RepID=A0ABP1Q204_9HEXA